MTGELVHLEMARGVATITLDSPNNRNALSRQLVSELHNHLENAIADASSRVVVLTGTGTVFCSGADLKEQRTANESGGSQSGPSGLPEILTTIWESPKPVIARVNGPARAGGLGLIAACDIAIAAETANFALSEVRIGVIPAIISVVLLPKLGLTTAMELFLTGDTFDARRAVEIGLLTAVSSAGELDATVARYVDSLRKGAPTALAGAKELVREVPSLPMQDAFREMARRSAEYFASDEAREGMTAFAEKRPPRWAEETP